MSNQKPEPKPEPKFEISAAVVFRLGEELITDVLQALIELVKNSYDADATKVFITIKTPDKTAPEGSVDHLGYIIIKDNGFGMNDEDFQRGWLTIAKSSKSAFKKNGKRTEKGRTPIGDKGLGRLGVQRLGHLVEITSKPINSNKMYKLQFSWEDFRKYEKLSSVPVVLTNEMDEKSTPGTTIKVIGLKDPEQWEDNKVQNTLRKKLAELLSPFKEVEDFSVRMSLNGEKIELAELAEQIRDTAVIRYYFEFDGEVFTLSGKVQLDFICRAQDKHDRLFLQDIIEADSGESYFNYMLDNKPKKCPPEFSFSKSGKWAFSYKYSKSLADLDGVKFSEENRKKPASPGPFNGEIDYLLLDYDKYADNIWDSKADYREYVKQLSGIRIYRDGFGIRVGDDWLNLGRQQTSGQSIYGLRPTNVLGYIALSASQNGALQETTSREGFMQSPYFDNFTSLMELVVKWSAEVQENMRRGALEYLSFKKEESIGVPPEDTEIDLRKKIKKKSQEVENRSSALKKIQSKVGELIKDTTSKINELTKKDKDLILFHKQELDEVYSILNEGKELIAKCNNELDNLPADEIATIDDLNEAIEQRIKKTRSELELLYEGVALGLTAEALSHEIATIAHKLIKQAGFLSNYLLKLEKKDIKVLNFVESVRSSCIALRKQLSHLAPSLRYVREEKNDLQMLDIVNEIISFYDNRFKESSIDVEIDCIEDFHIRMNKGKLIQIIDNILLNSEYWLNELNRTTGGKSKTKITIHINKPKIIIFDSGKGVSPSLEKTLFEPFVSDKKIGRGLGLFIVSQLLESEGCSIRLCNNRNNNKRLYKFEINLRGALSD